MQRKKLIAVGIALALQTYYLPAIAADSSDDDNDCPTDVSVLSKDERNKLSARCVAGYTEQDNHWGWVAGGIAALTAGVAIGIDNNGGGHSHYNDTPTTPSDNGSDVTPTPPDDDGGDVTPTPPDDDGGDVTPTPPDDTSVITFSNGITIDKGLNTLTFDDIRLDSGTDLGGAMWNYSEQDDQWQIALEDGKTLLVSDWKVTDSNAAVIEGTVQGSGLYWKYDSQGYLIVADDQTTVATGDDESHAADRGVDTHGAGKTGVIISGDRTNNALSGDSSVSDGAVGIVITGDNTTNTISGQSTVDGATGALISGDDTTTRISGGIDVTGGGTGMVIDGDRTTVDNTGISNISGQGSTGSIVNGDNSHVINDGELNVADGATGAKITGDDVFIDNKGDTTASGAGSFGLNIDGDNATINNEGKQDISDGATGIFVNGNSTTFNNTGTTEVSGADSTGIIITGDKTRITNDGELNVTDGATGTQINGDGAVIDNTGDTTVTGAGSTGQYIKGDNARIANTGDITVDGAGSTAAVIDGNDNNLTQAGDMLVTNGATGIVANGTGDEVKNTGNATVRDRDSVGFVVAGEQNTFSNKGDINVSLNGTGALVNGNTSQITLDGDINVNSAQDSSGIFRGATGVNVSGDSNAVDITGDVNLSADYAKEDKIDSGSPLTGVSVSGNNNDITLDGALNFDVNAQTSATEQIVGLNVNGDNNSVKIDGGINVSHNSSEDSNVSITAINIDGDSQVVLSGQSSIDTTTIVGGMVTLAQVNNGGSLILTDASSIDISAHYVSNYYFTDNALLLASGEGSSIENNGSITSHGVYSIIKASNGAEASNSGDILVYATDNSSNDDDRTAIVRAEGEGSMVHNQSGGDISLISDQKPSENNGIAEFPLMWYNHTFYAMAATRKDSSVINDEGATIHLQGAGVYGVSASKGTARNEGDIYLDGLVPTLDDEGNITGTSYWHPSSLYLTSTGMVAGSTDSGQGDATATNTGTITVNNAGFGMMALNGGTAINQGTINLTADEGVTQTDENQLVGMAALNGGLVINDTSGTINIEAAYGKPFLTDSSSNIVNYGTVCFGDDCQDSDEYNPTDSNVSLSLLDGGVITAEGETLTDKTIITDPAATGTVHVTNAGTVSGGKVIVKNYGDVTNESTGSISSVSIDTGGVYTNDGTTAAVSVDGGVFNNTGTVTGKTGTTVAGSVINNSGSMNTVEQWSSTMNNTGTVTAWTGASGGAVLNNNAGGEVDKLNFTAAATVNNAGVIKNGSVDKSGTLNNLEGGVMTLADNGLWSGTFNNWGTVNSDADIATGGSGHTLYNGSTGVINGQVTTSKNNGGSKAINDGTINIDKTNNVAMSAHGSAKMVNNGTINVGTVGTTQTGMVGMQLESDAKSDAVIENNGTINIYASNSYAFSQLGSNGHIVNNGTVYIDDNVTGSGFIKQDGKTIEGSGENGDGTEVHYVDFTAPTEPTITDGTTTVTTSDSADSSATNNLSGYVVGTSADGSAGKLMVSNASMNGVEINTGFTAGTADTSVSFDNVVEGSNLYDASAIQSTSVVWNAQGSQDSNGNVDVTMTKNAYADVATDASVSGVASALDAGYTNNELYTSLNVGTTAELNSALKQVSGAQATTVFREARVLSNRFTMLADAAPQIKDGLAFNVVAKGDPRAELGNDTQYDMLALRQTLDLTASQNLTLEYGIARLDGDGSKTAGDNGLTGGYSQFFGLKHSMAFDEGLAWNNSLRYDVHNLDSSRSVSYGDTNKVADSDARQQYLEFRSEGAKTFTMMGDALKVTPYVGVKFRHTLEGSYKERSAGDFNLSMNAGSETAVDSIVGMKLDYTGENGWSASATLEGGPNLSYSKSQRTASLQGAAGQSFSVDDDQKGGGVNGLATVGVKYSAKDASLNLDAYQWKEDGISDKGFMLNFRKTFR
ncbi:autotransporter domain-containing protein [Citrobacter sp. EC_71]|uniref:BigA/YdbA N-terminal beta-barrel domain-containing protein n=1 Tax=Citrobacter sp. EC_71 TaxID=2584093 RepID=UPI0010CA0D97|nr:autotransporter outer membrane beta-barrel domain-containing protein [Citrobacter sp. EC_71]MBW9350026.1 autotransporter domain-containing protein [Citrobacter sp. EC_71]TKT98739.1 autotransporter domain-containing protein [Citrobacter sp. wls830]